jgi:hypothetical protein
VLVDGKNALQWGSVSRGRRLGDRNLEKRLAFCQEHLNAQAGAWIYCDCKQLFCYPEGGSNNTYSWQEADEQPQQRAGSNPVVFHVYAVVGKGLKSQLVYTAPSAPKGSKQRRGKDNFASKYFIALAKQLHMTIKAAGKDSRRHPIVLDGAKQHTSDATSAAIEVMACTSWRAFHLRAGCMAVSSQVGSWVRTGCVQQQLAVVVQNSIGSSISLFKLIF